MNVTALSGADPRETGTVGTRKPGQRKPKPVSLAGENPVETGSEVMVDSPSENTGVTETPNTETTDTVTENTSMQFQKVSTHKNGLTSYSTPGLRGSIYIGKGVFAKDAIPPDTIEVVAENLVAPTAEQIEKANKRAERKTRVKATLAERAAKAQAKAEKAAANAAKLQARLAKQNPAEGTAAPAEGTAAPAAEPAFAGVTE